MAEMVPGLSLPQFLAGQSLVWIQFALATPVVLWGGLPFFKRGWASLVSRSLNMFTLISLGPVRRFRFQCNRRAFSGHFP